MELKRIDVFLFKILYLAVVGVVVSQTLDLDNVTSFLFLLTFPLTVLLWIRSVRSTLTGGDVMMLITAALAVVSVFLDVMLSGARLNFDYLRKLIMFIMTLLFFQTAYRVRVKQDVARFINNLVDILTLYLIFMYFTSHSQMYLLNGYVTQYLTFRFDNPNTTGLFLTCLYMLETFRLFTRERWYAKLLHIVMALFMAWFVVQTRSRNCLLVMAMFTTFCAWLAFRSKRKLRISKTWSVIFAWFPLLFFGAYMVLVYTPWIQEVFSFLVDIGKGLDSRMKIWIRALNHIAESPLIGAYNGISNGTGSSQLHNTHLDIAASYGIPVLILVGILLERYLYQKGRYYADKESFAYILGFACALILGMAEAALFSGGLGIYIFAGTFLLLSAREQPNHTGTL